MKTKKTKQVNNTARTERKIPFIIGPTTETCKMNIHSNLSPDTNFGLLALHAFEKAELPRIEAYWEIPRNEISWAGQCLWFIRNDGFFTMLTCNRTKETKFYTAAEMIKGMQSGAFNFEDFTPHLPVSKKEYDYDASKVPTPSFRDREVEKLARKYEWRKLDDGRIVTFAIDPDGNVLQLCPDDFKWFVAEIGVPKPYFLGVMAGYFQDGFDDRSDYFGFC